MLEFATVAVLNVCHNRAIGMRFDFDFGNAWEPLSQFVTIVVSGSTELVKVELLIKPHIFRGAFTRPRVPRVVKTAAVRVPSQIAAGGAAIYTRNGFKNRLSGRGFVDMHVARFVAPMRQRNSDELAVRRWFVPINRGRTLFVDFIWIDEHTRLVRLKRRGHDDQERLLFGRLSLDGKVLAVAQCDA